MTYNKWPSPHGHAIASDKTDKMPQVANAVLDANIVLANDELNAMLKRLNDIDGVYHWDGMFIRAALQTPASDGVLEEDVERCVARVIAAVKNNVSTSIRNDVLNDLETIKRALKQSTAKDTPHDTK